jgi:hypothetical protein
MSDTPTRFDFRKRVAYDAEAKRRFHRHARAQLLKLAEALGLEPHEYDLRSNEGGIAVSGEITLHADHLYVQVSQPATRADSGILFRSCEGRCDYTGGRNNFASLDLLHRPDELAALIRRHVPLTAVEGGVARASRNLIPPSSRSSPAASTGIAMASCATSCSPTAPNTSLMPAVPTG